MNKLHEKQKDLFRTTECASYALNLSANEIKARFGNFPLYLSNYIDNEKQEEIIEVRFDIEGITVSCSFDNDKKCDMTFIFLDRSEELDDYILFLTDNYDYDFIRSCWNLPNCYVKVKITQDDTFFCAYNKIL